MESLVAKDRIPDTEMVPNDGLYRKEEICDHSSNESGRTRSPSGEPLSAASHVSEDATTFTRSMQR